MRDERAHLTEIDEPEEESTLGVVICRPWHFLQVQKLGLEHFAEQIIGIFFGHH